MVLVERMMSSGRLLGDCLVSKVPARIVAVIGWMGGRKAASSP